MGGGMWSMHMTYLTHVCSSAVQYSGGGGCGHHILYLPLKQFPNSLSDTLKNGSNNIK